ncbi:hypothetical protein A1Q1_00855 [Trichosporon asahii var. asahii CBS 2479]|uniref:Uncharacterized protein n=1 Tax=Trichosporon asahii var. asahii (strain ATCC 90039 / CBS 2479 / JCM 2466 / KCTC 7840 / NBRC 103889/ NCYC 2677 / UAMH 7654) TaxID=1186058 RepID=J6EZE0_TRIAS|nr:hypothetical protein A1Q1_00855 [Trichosporon asahii var. asahii CBS 2479]EJT50014.1 hypothetical protein A1Q1_00855 [Trichosporon asahii var. asahii CBS 2479]
MLALRRLVPVTRSFHTSAIAYRKQKAAAPAEEVSFDDDLFAGASEEVVSEGSGDRADRRREYINNITDGTVERAGELRKVIQLSDNEAQLEELDRVLRAWRVLGRKVSNQTAKELVGRCINLGRPDLAQKYVNDRLQYGVPTIPNSLRKKFEDKLSTVAKAAEAPSAAQAEGEATA